VPVTPATVSAADPDGLDGEILLPNVDPLTERIEQISARTAFAANLRLIEAATEMTDTLLDLKA